MSVDEAVRKLVNEQVGTRDYLTTAEAKQAKAIANECCKLLEVELKEATTEINRTAQRLEKLWDRVDKISRPKHPKLHKFFEFQWLRKLAFWEKR